MIHLTFQEKKVILFLSFLFAVGCGVTVFKKSSGCSLCLIDVYSQKKAAPLDINKATREELIALPGIGEATAENIIVSRSTNGPFAHIEDLKRVKGVSDALLLRLKDKVVF
jgi:competence ComEA-like helix-hairpin-helix protein